MKNSRSIAYGALLLTAMVSTGLRAQDATGFSAGASLLTGVGHTADLAGVKSGVNVWGAYTIKTEGGYNVRPGLAINNLIGSGVSGVAANADDLASAGEGYNVPGSSLKHTFTSVQVFSDFVVPIFDNKANWIIGLSLSKYSVKVSGARAGEYSPFDLDAATRNDGSGSVVRSGNANGTVSVPGYKFGLRVGFDYKINKQLSVQCLLQQTELGRIWGQPTQLPTLNPAWLEVGVNYHF